MPIVSTNDQNILNQYTAIVQNGFGVGTRTSPDVATYRKVMQELDDAFLFPKGFVSKIPVASFEAERTIRPGLTAGVCVPRGSGPFPILIHAHGHGLRAGHPRIYEGWIKTMASHGFVVIFPDYHLQPEVTYESQVEEMNFAIQWAKQNARSLKGDATKLFIGGDSSGGFLALDVMNRHLENPNGERFRAYMCIDGQINGERADALLAKWTPQTPLPPIYIEVGSADPNAGLPCTRFAVKLMELRKNFQMDVAYGQGHDFIKMPRNDQAVESNRRAMEFLKKTL